MNRIAHWINCGCWIANTVVWTYWAESLFMGLASLAAATLAGYLAYHSDPWDARISR